MMQNDENSAYRADTGQMTGKSRNYYGFGIAAAKKIKVCSRCGAVSPASERYCSECGCALPDKNLYELSVEGKPRCRSCGAVLSRDGNYCPACGKPRDSTPRDRTPHDSTPHDGTLHDSTPHCGVNGIK